MTRILSHDPCTLRTVRSHLGHFPRALDGTFASFDRNVGKDMPDLDFGYEVWHVLDVRFRVPPLMKSETGMTKSLRVVRFHGKVGSPGFLFFTHADYIPDTKT